MAIRPVPCHRCAHALVNWREGGDDPKCYDTDTGSLKCERCYSSHKKCDMLSARYRRFAKAAQDAVIANPDARPGEVITAQQNLKRALREVKSGKKMSPIETFDQQQQDRMELDGRMADAAESIREQLTTGVGELRLLRMAVEGWLNSADVGDD